MMKKEVSSLVLSMTLVVFIGCGGGSGGSSDEPTEAVDQNIEQPQTEEGVQEDITIEELISSANFRIGSIKQTGQIKSFNSDGDEVTDSSILDDGYYKKGVSPSYLRASNMIIDELTGLIWQDNEDVGNISKLWLTEDNAEICYNDESADECSDTSGDTAATYCTNLNLGGYTDWRVPTIEELATIMNFNSDNLADRIKPIAIDTNTFQYTDANGPSSSYRFWTSNSIPQSDEQYYIDFTSGQIVIGYATYEAYVRCVRDAE